MALKTHVEPTEEITCIPEYDTQQVVLMKQDEPALVERLRRGDEQACETLFRYLQGVFLKYARHLEQSSGIDYRDLVQTAQLDVLTNFERILLKREPIPMCLAVGRNAMFRYCYEYRGLIRRPPGGGRRKVAPFQIASLDEPLGEDEGSATLGDLIAAPVIRESDASQRDYTALYVALEQLRPQTKEVVIRHYGLLEQPAETYQEIAGVVRTGDAPLSRDPIYCKERNRTQHGVCRLRDLLEREGAYA